MDGLQDRLYAAYNQVREVGRAILLHVRDEITAAVVMVRLSTTYHFFQEAWEQAMGITLVHQRVRISTIISGDRCATLQHTLKTNNSETAGGDRKRLMAEAIAFIANLQPIDPNGGTFLKGRYNQT